MCFFVLHLGTTHYTNREMRIVSHWSNECQTRTVTDDARDYIRMRKTRRVLQLRYPLRRPFEKHPGRMLALKVMLLHIGEKGMEKAQNSSRPV